MITTRTLKQSLAAIVAFTLISASVAAPALAQSQSGAAQTPPSGTSRTAKEKPAPSIVNLNTASAAELQTLKGVGPAMATRILEYRQKNGGFKKIEDLMNVRGIGEKTFLKLKPMITIAPPKAVGL